jgi:hypothetical protein
LQAWLIVDESQLTGVHLGNRWKVTACLHLNSSPLQARGIV